MWHFGSRCGPEEKAVLSVTDQMLSDASWLLVQMDVKTVNMNERGGREGPPGLEQAFFLWHGIQAAPDSKILTEAVGRCPVVVLPVAVLEDYIQVVIPLPPSCI